MSSESTGSHDDPSIAAGVDPLAFSSCLAIFEESPHPVALWRLIYDEQGQPSDLEVQAANRSFRTLFRLPDIVGRRTSEIEPRYHEKGPDVVAIGARVIATGAPEEHELYHPRLERWLHFKVARIPDDLLVTYADDVTARQEADSAVRRLQYSLDHVEDYPLWSNSRGQVVQVSKATCRYLEYSRDELLDMTVFDICPEANKQKWGESWKRHKSQGSWRFETRHRSKSGRVFPVELTVNPVTFDGEDYHFTFCRDISERKALEESLALTQLSVDNAPDMIHWVDREGYITYANRALCEFLGYALAELQTMRIWDVSPELTPEVFKERWAASAETAMYLAEEVWRTKSGRKLTVDISAVHVMQGGKEMGLAFVRDVTDRKLAEQSLKESEERYRQLWQTQTETLKTLRDRDEQLLQAQKMEAVGRLAGGIAHDFNNVLTTIIGYSDLLLSSDELPEGSVGEDIAEIKQAAERAAGLTQRILAFSRRQAMEPTVLSLNKVVSDTERLLSRTIGADIELKTSLDPDLHQVEVDEQQFVQVLLNLAVNARDAMPDGGTLTLETANVEMDEQFCKTHPEAVPGPYVRLAVTDTGGGMEEEVLSHVFEPFYTTKPPGLGTGLGLATVYGVVTQSGGCVYVESELGSGTTVTVYLPRASVEASGAEATSTEAADIEATDPPVHTVVVVDSDAPFRNLSTRILERHGIQVLSFGDGEQATGSLSDPGVRIDALLTDLSLSGHLQGKQLASLATADRHHLPVLFVTAQVADIPDETNEDDPNVTYLEKPFTAEELTDWVRTWLLEPRPADSQGRTEVERPHDD